MKLNLLPTTVSKQRQAQTAYVIAALILLVALGAAVPLALIPQQRLAQSKVGIDESKRKAADAVAYSKMADTIIAQAADVIRDASLAKAMIDHNDVYPKLYEDVSKYVPPFFRLRDLSATAIDDKSSRITMTGTITTYQRYADLMLALMRFPGAKSISRSGYTLTDKFVPQVTLTDQEGKPRKPTDAVIPDDKLEQITYFQSQVQPQGYLNIGNFGAESTVSRGAMPDESLITVTLTVSRNLQVPNALATIQQAGAGGGSAVASLGGGGAGPFGPGGPGGGSPFGPGSGAPAGPPAGGGSKKGED